MNRNMNLKMIIAIIIGIVGVAIMIPSVSNLVSLQKEVDDARPVFVNGFEEELSRCEKAVQGSNDPIESGSKGTLGGLFDMCKEGIIFYLSECSFYGNPPICDDPRIEKFRD